MEYKNKSKKGGYTAYYANASRPNDYMLYDNSSVAATKAPEVYVPPNSDLKVQDTLYNLPNMSGGGRSCKENGLKNCDAFEFDKKNSFLYSLSGGCACNSSAIMGGFGNNELIRKKLRGGDVILTPFITAISILAARLLTDRNIGLFPIQGGDRAKQMRQRRLR